MAIPTTRPRQFVTETDELAVALDDAAAPWPGLSRPQPLVRLALEGHRKHGMSSSSSFAAAGSGAKLAFFDGRSVRWPSAMGSRSSEPDPIGPDACQRLRARHLRAAGGA